MAAVIAAGLLAAATGVATGSEAVAHETCAATVTSSDEGICYLPTTVVNLNSSWRNTGLAVELQPGTYHLDLDVHGRLWGPAPINAWISARLTADGAVLPGSQRMIDHLQSYNADDGAIGHRDTTPIQERIEIQTPTRIQLQARSTYDLRYNSTTIAEIRSDSASYTSIRWEKVKG
ncbi:hypothetical protein ACLB9X_05890 [Streptomyces sp. 5K101]|uniref:hypothetical protein n=1 Tax=Streptomyces sp. 5K101 TaxID=3390037 RepID=UPI003976F1B9